MAPPANRRSGYSRRAQYGTFFSYLAGVIGAGIGVWLLLASHGDATVLSGLRGAAADATAAPARLTAQTRAAGSSAFDVLGGYFTAGAENARLRREVALARVKLAEQAALSAENQRLKAALGLAQDNVAKPVATAWMIASSGSSTRRYALISAGAGQGVHPGMPVRTALGLVGRVLETGRSTARVLLVIDTESVVPVRRARDGMPAFATGRPDGTLQIRLISLGINPLRPGDAFVTSGAGGLYWPGTPIAVVTALTRDGAIGRVLADPAASEVVSVQPEWNPVRDATLPPPPDPTAKRAKSKT
ncbi:MAG: rod shape-determining protein MreC [Sphingomonadales bacterium]|nr:rod shape-determining protein MreC [Sphingomonadales bacterium]